jgi:hypothetical protein
MDTNSGPFILCNQFFRETYTEDQGVSLFLAKLQQYQTRLAFTKYLLADNKLIAYVLTQGTLPTKFDSILEYLYFQQSILTWTTLMQILINKDVELSIETNYKSPTTAITAQASKRKSNKEKRFKKFKIPSSTTKSDNRSNSDKESNIDTKKKAICCFYCCKRGYKVSEYNLKKKADKLWKKQYNQGYKYTK